jgi:serine/threonine-protein kinase HipA
MPRTQSTKRGRVYVNTTFAGMIEQREGLYIFTYDTTYCELSGAEPVSLTLPIRKEPFEQKTMIPFFDGLIPEGWLLNIITDNWKIDRKNRMQLLLLACKDCIGNVSVVAEEGEDE